MIKTGPGREIPGRKRMRMKKYYSTQRPVSIGTFPSGKNVRMIVNFADRSYVDSIGRMAYGYIIFAEPLSEKEASDYELTEALGGEGGER